MSFKCQITGKTSDFGEKLNKIVVETRPKSYRKWVKDEISRSWSEVDAGSGFETVKELSVSEAGLLLWNSWSEDDRKLFLNQLR